MKGDGQANGDTPICSAIRPMADEGLYLRGRLFEMLLPMQEMAYPLCRARKYIV